MNLGNRFKSYRKRQGLSQKEAAELLGVKGYQLANYETGRSEPSIFTLKKMSRLYKASIDQLVGNYRFGPSPEEQEAYEKEKAAYHKKLQELLDMLKEQYGE